MARNLGASRYGAFVAVTAVAAVIYPFVGNGCSNLMIKHVARDRALLPEFFGASLVVTFISGVSLSILGAFACFLVLPPAIAPSVIIMVIVSDMLIAALANVASLAFWSLEMMKWTASLETFAALTRLAGIATVVAIHRPTLLAWSVAYVAASVASCTAAIGCAAWRLGIPKLAIHRLRGQVLEGFYFSAGFSAQTVYNDIDKIMLARLSTLGAAGIYAAAYRLIDVAFVPVRSLLAAAYPGFFRAGVTGIAGTLAFAKTAMPRAAVYSAVAALIMISAAPVVPRILGSQYADTAAALRWLALLPLLKTLHYFAADSLSGAGYQGLRTIVQICVAAFNVLVNLWIIPAFAWRGAAWSSLASDSLLAVSLWLCCMLLRRKQMPMHVQEVAS